MRWPRLRAALGTLLGGLIVPGSLAAQDVTVHVDVSTLQELAAAAGALKATGRYKLTTGSGWYKITWCDSAYTVDLGIPTFTINTGGIHARGSGSASWCGVTLPVSFQADGDVVADGLRAVRVDFSSVTVSPRFCVPLIDMCASPFSFDVGGAVNVPAIPIEVSPFHFETARGPRQLRVSPRSLSILKGNGFVELRSNVELW